MTKIIPTLNTRDQAVSYAPMEMLRAWHAASADAGVPGSSRYIEEPDAYSRKANVLLRMALIEEEFREVMDELMAVLNGKGNRVKLAHELADLLYVVYGAGDDFELPLQEVFTEIHRANMTKIGANGRVERAKNGKILKGPNYTPPNIESIVLPGVAS